MKIMLLRKYKQIEIIIRSLSKEDHWLFKKKNIRQIPHHFLFHREDKI